MAGVTESSARVDSGLKGGAGVHIVDENVGDCLAVSLPPAPAREAGRLHAEFLPWAGGLHVAVVGADTQGQGNSCGLTVRTYHSL